MSYKYRIEEQDYGDGIILFVPQCLKENTKRDWERIEYATYPYFATSKKEAMAMIQTHKKNNNKIISSKIHEIE